MPKAIVWSRLADHDFDGILEYLALNWDTQTVENFMEHTFRLMEQISLNPKKFPLINTTIRKCVISKHNTIYYRETKTAVEILRLFDTRQDPNKLKLS